MNLSDPTRPFTALPGQAQRCLPDLHNLRVAHGRLYSRVRADLLPGLLQVPAQHANRECQRHGCCENGE